MPRGPKKLLVVTYASLAEFLGVSEWTVKGWARKGKLDVSSLQSVMDMKTKMSEKEENDG